VLVAVGLAVTRRYPMSMRLALYVVPSVLMLLAAGVVSAVAVAPALGRWTGALRPALWAATAVACSLLLITAGGGTIAGVRKLWRPDEVTSGREAVAFVVRHRQPGDLVLVESWGLRNAGFYGPRLGMTWDGMFYLSAHACHGDVLLRLEGQRRVWLLLAHRQSAQPVNRSHVYLSHFETRGSLVLAYHGYGDAGAYLLDFAKRPDHPAPPLPLWFHPGCLTISMSQ